jgi:drug/metabolite transporter (DMT)-like permease
VTAGEVPGALQLAGLAIASLAIASLAFVGGRRERGAAGFALATGGLIAAYTLVDGQGSRISGVLTFIAWSQLLDVGPIALIVWFTRRGQIRAHLERDGWRGAAGGLIGLVTYTIVLWAMTQAPLAAVSMLRETSVIFAALLAAALLREPVGARRIAATLAVFAGGALLLAG